MNKEFVITQDGSHTIYLPLMDEHYHSTFGAVQESLHIYINAGFLQLQIKEVSILEIGFGTGLNALLTYIFAVKQGIRVKYQSIEKYPLSEHEIKILNYTDGQYKEYAAFFDRIHRAPWDTEVEIAPGFVLHKILGDMTTFAFDLQDKIDLVYYDAFAPSKQPELWTNALIQKVADCVKTGGIVVTYCAKGSVRRSFEGAGFKMERLPGPPGKKEFIRGKKT
jgi:tRNA U34 5-methylaminomethyl-2-thiouridine-forming methyltransferase MnmC